MESNAPASLESTPKKLLFWENNRSANNAGNSKAQEELMTIRLREMEAVTELRELRVHIMEMETQVMQHKRASNIQMDNVIIFDCCKTESSPGQSAEETR